MAAVGIIRWVLAGALALVWLFFALGNAAALVNGLIRKKPVSFGLFVGGIAGAVSLMVVPLPGFARWVWLPPLIDVGCGPVLISMLWGLVAPGSRGTSTNDAEVAMPDAMTVETANFGTVAVSDDGIVVMDGGTHGCVGHTLAIDAAHHASWERRLDSMGDPDECSGSGSLDLSGEDRGTLAGLTDALWTYAGELEVPPSGEQDFDVPRYVWAVVLRRAGEIRTLEGPPVGHPWDEPPAAVGAAIEWMRDRVRAWCAAQVGDATPRGSETS
jgi:hypothetical protein